MSRFRFGLTAALFVALSAVALVGCGPTLREDEDDGPGRKKPGGGTPAPAKTLTAIKATAWGTIKGEVKWDGGAFTPSPIDLKVDSAECAKGTEFETTQNDVWVGANGKLGNVFVWIEAPRGSYFEVPEAQLAKYKGKTVTVGQPRCAFLPRCAVLFPSHLKDGKAEATGQLLEVKNNAKVSHNYALVSTLNRDGRTLAPDKSDTLTLTPDSAPITVSCSIHNWMRGCMRAFNHPYAALTKVGENAEKAVYQDKAAPDFGTYEITGVPVGAKVTLVAWHETLGVLEKREVTLKEKNEGAEFNFTATKK